MANKATFNTVQLKAFTENSIITNIIVKFYDRATERYLEVDDSVSDE